MTSTEFDRFSSCSSTKKIWDGLELAYEGTTVVKKQRIALLIRKYEPFSMEQNETLDSMSTRFSSIINELKNLGKTFDSEEIARKILRSLSKSWRPKVTVIEECRNLSELSYQELIGALMAYKITLDVDDAEASSSKKMALQAKTSEKQDSDLEDETMLFAKRFKKKIFNRKQGKTPNNNTNKTSKKTTESKGSFSNRGCFNDNESEYSNTEMCLVGDSDSDDEEEVSYLELKKQVKKLSKSSLVKYFEESLDHSHEQSLELKDLKEQILDIAEENQLLKAKAKKLKSKIIVKETNQWYLDSGCSRHMTGNKNLFLSPDPFDGGKVTFGDNKKGKIVGIGKIGISSTHTINNVYL
ncbi:uncharacterized protein LOC141607426 [Silene latifolia]|uniref:uncharacterized protein LOC141607426 n=1 Tax=Silene latifolia TaxID=37657 RepID=UPI003D76CD2D